MEGISWSSVVGGLFTISFEVNVVDLVMQHVPYGHKQFSCHCDNHLHLVLSSHNGPVIGDSAEEAILRPAAQAHWMMLTLRYLLPWVVLRDLIFLLDSSFLGRRPLQEARWFAVSNLLMSVPISAINDVAARSLIPVWSASG